MAFTCQCHPVSTELHFRTPSFGFLRPNSSANPCHTSHHPPQTCAYVLAGRHAPQAFGSGPQRSPRPFARSRSCQIRASSGDSPQESSQTAMSPQEAYELLGVEENTKFEQIMSIKNKLVSKAGNDAGRKSQLETAYDTLLMQAMQKRIAGEVAGQSVRFADVPKRRPAGQVAKQAIQKLPGGLTISKLSKDDSLKQGGAFTALAAWALIQGLTDPPGVAQADVPGLQLALAVIISLYIFRDKKRLGLARAGGITAAGLIAGAAIGSAAQSWLRVDIVPIGGFSSPGIFVGEFALTGLWAAAAFLA